MNTNKMKTTNWLIGLVLLMLTSGTLKAQQEAQFTQAFENIINVNPAYAGSRGVMNFSDISRAQWIGFDGNPQTTALSMNTPVFKESLGTGLSLVHDRVGPMKQTTVNFDVASSVKVDRHGGRLAVGLQGGFNAISVRTDNLQTTDFADPELMYNLDGRVNLNMGVGMYYYSPVWYAGISTPKVLEKSYDGLVSNNLEQRHYYCIAGGIFSVHPDWKLKPAMQLRFTNNAPLDLDLSMSGIFRDRLWLGTMYRLNAAYGVFVQYQVTPQFKAGVASDFDTSRIRKYHSGSFEVLLSYDLMFNKAGIRSPRYF